MKVVRPELSVIIPVSEQPRVHPVEALYTDYQQRIAATGLSYEFIYVLDGSFKKVYKALCALREKGENITIIRLARWHGESTALTAGFEQAKGERILTLPPFYQVDGAAITELIQSAPPADMVIVRRWPRSDSLINRLQTRAFHLILKWILGVDFHDLGCSIRLFNRRILEKVSIYGDQHRFLPILAHRYGYKVREVPLAQSKQDIYQKLYPMGVYSRRLLDLLSIFFLVKFTRKPLRFFGLTGLTSLLTGGVYTGYLVIQRLYMGVPLADRPALLLGLLLIVLGIQLFAIGLVGELIIFTHAREQREYTIEQIVN